MDALGYNILIQLLRNGTLSLDDCVEIRDRLAEEGEEDAAHAALAAFFEVTVSSQRDFEREQARPQLRIVSSDRKARED